MVFMHVKGTMSLIDEEESPLPGPRLLLIAKGGTQRGRSRVGTWFHLTAVYPRLQDNRLQAVVDDH